MHQCVAAVDTMLIDLNYVDWPEKPFWFIYRFVGISVFTFVFSLKHVLCFNKFVFNVSLQSSSDNSGTDERTSKCISFILINIQSIKLSSLVC